ncbi:MAG: nuclear transport factor 2 family protein [Solirubrobacteraceae bacterium]|nr:nuclear transport factor 2 family protein [Solirubrobacteraceae bacterium]
MPQWVEDFYEGVDGGDLSVYGRFFADDISLRFGSGTPEHGMESVVAALTAAHDTLELSHTIGAVWQSAEHTLVEASVDYTLKSSGASATLPAFTVFHRRGERVDEMRVYVDLGPLFGGGDH